MGLLIRGNNPFRLVDDLCVHADSDEIRAKSGRAWFLCAPVKRLI